MKKRILAALLVFVALLTGCSRKETTGQWPSQKIEIDVCYTAGGTADTVARQLSALMSQQLSTTFNLVNVTGGSGSSLRSRSCTRLSRLCMYCFLQRSNPLRQAAQLVPA